MYNPESVPENETYKVLSFFFLNTNTSPNFGQTTRSSDNQRERERERELAN